LRSFPARFTTNRPLLQRSVATKTIPYRLYEPLYPDAWHDEGAFFVAAGSEPPVEVALAAIGALTTYTTARPGSE
jgi:hypothetical protein